jgi:uncharacterized protein (TIGR00661 family)
MKRVLITPLDWGLGHATRCVPVIQELLTRSCTVFIGGSGDSLALLRKEFPALKFFELPAYHPTYDNKGRMVRSMLRQLPKFIRTISSEHQALERIIDDEKIDFVISDNRYGCWSKNVPSVLITHQSNALMPKRFGWLSPIVRALVGRMIQRFSIGWIPDVEGPQNLTGDMVWKNINFPFRHIGHLSRLVPARHVEKKYDLLCVLSGPEPQRTRLEEILVKQIDSYSGRTLIVRGLPIVNGRAPLTTSAEVKDFLTSDELQVAIESAALILSRSGFSTVMDLSRVGSRAIFIPTPGQTEQEYLAGQLKGKGIAFSMEQEKFDLTEAIKRAGEFKGFSPDTIKHFGLTKALDELMQK